MIKIRPKTEIDWEKVKDLREKYCTKKHIAEHLDIYPKNLLRRAKKEDIDLSLPDSKSHIQKPVNEVQRFWEIVEKFKDGGIIYGEALHRIQEEIGWSLATTREYLDRFGITEKKKFENAQTPRIYTIDSYPRELNAAEKKVSNLFENVKVLHGYGADFVLDSSILAEVKTSLNKSNASKALVQLLYGENLLGDDFDKRVYCKKSSLGKGKYAEFSRYYRLFNIDLYVYRNGGFQKTSIQRETES